MKRKLALAVAIVSVFALIGFAVPTTVDVDWDAFGTGTPLVITFQNGDDALSTVVTTGAHFFGTFHAEDKDDNPYTYSVDSGLFQTTASVEGGGGILFEVERTDAKATMYGPAGQISHSEVWTTDGTAFLARRTTTNYASARNCNYSFQSNDQYQAAGTSYGIVHSVSSGDGDGATIQVLGSGSGVLTSMSDELGGRGFQLGNGCGCYHNSDFEAAGSGVYEIMAVGSNSLAGQGWSAPGGGTYFEQLIYNDGADVDDVHVAGD